MMTRPFIRCAFVVLAMFSLVSSAFASEQGRVCRYCGRDHAAEMAAAAEARVGGGGRNYAPDRVVDVLHIKIDVTPDFEKRTVAGTTTLTFAPISKPVSEVVLDAVDLDVDKVESSVPLADYVVTREKITLFFKEPIAVGKETEVSITYSAEPKQGLYFRTEAMGYPKGDDHIWTQGQTHEAAHWFPCFDYPNERATSEVICTLPKEMVVISNGQQLSEVEHPSGKKTVRWKQDIPHASYLICMVAGHFHKLEANHGDLKLRFFSQPSLAEHAANAFADTRQIIAFYEEEIGVDFPWAKYDQATIRDFNSGGMENTTITTLYERTIRSKATENIYTARNLDAHETAHQWFGDYVTCEDWGHLWLNEGFATYYTHLYNEHKLGRDELLYGLWEDAEQDVLPQGDDPRPIVYRDYDTDWEQFDFRAYPKGSWVLHMLRSQFGKDVYRKAIKSYLEKNKLTSVVTPDLIDAFEKTSGVELDQFFDQWVYNAGNPDLDINYRWLPKEKMAVVSIEQTQEVNDHVRLFEFPVTLRFHCDGKVVDHEIRVRSESEDFYVPLPSQPEVVRFDPHYSILADVDFDKTQSMLIKQLELEGDMIGRLMAAKALRRRDSQKSVKALAKSLGNDAFYGVRIQAAESLAKIGTDAAFEALVESTEQSDARVRKAVVDSIGKFYRPEAMEQLKQVAADEKNPAIVAEALKGLGKFPADKVRGTLEEGLTTESFGDEVAAAAAHALGMSGDAELRKPMLDALKGKQRHFDTRSYAGSLKVLAKLWRDADDKSDVRMFLEDCLQDPARRIRFGAIEALGELGDPQALAALRTFADREGNGRDEATVKRAIKNVQSRAPFVPREVRELRKLVDDLKSQQAELEEEIESLKKKAEARKDDGDDDDDDEEDEKEDEDDEDK